MKTIKTSHHSMSLSLFQIVNVSLFVLLLISCYFFLYDIVDGPCFNQLNIYDVYFFKWIFFIICNTIVQLMYDKSCYIHLKAQKLWYCKFG